MPVFDWIAKDSDGKVVKGTSEAECEEALVARLRGCGYWVQKVTSDQPSGRKAKDSEEPIKRVVAVILGAAIKEGAEHVDIELSADTVKVLFAIGEEHHETMAVPAYVWSPLLKEFCQMAGAPEPQEGSETGGPFQFEADGKTYEILFMGSTSGARLEITPE